LTKTSIKEKKEDIVGTRVRRNPVQRTPAGDLRSDAETRSDAESLGDDEAEARTPDDEESMDVEIIEEPEEGGAEQLAPLFAAENAADYRARWDVVQRGFVDDPARAVHDGDALLSEVINALAVAAKRTALELERELSRNPEASTETLRRALQRHRAFFERLLSF
jgi:hypothetical protein